tara:strand:- start:2431 stop:4437 length:2007 start_codon:yes stop_codon:yes gene_type:complete
MIGYDVETFKIVHSVAPEVVCCAFWDGEQRLLLNKIEGLQRLKGLLRAGEHIVAHNAQFDMISSILGDWELLKEVGKAYAEGRIHCTKIREIMLNTADIGTRGEYLGMVSGTEKGLSKSSLGGCVWNYLNVDLSDDKHGTDSWRLRYAELADIPINRWPIDAKSYALEDAVYALKVYEAQKERNAAVLVDARRQAYAEFVLQMMASVLGVGVNVRKIGHTRKALMKEHDKALALCGDLYTEAEKEPRGVKKNTQKVTEMFERAWEILEYDEPALYTSKGKLSTSENSRRLMFKLIEQAAQNGRSFTNRILGRAEKDELAKIFERVSAMVETDQKWSFTNNFIKGLEKAKAMPDSRVRYSYQGLKATGRTSSSKPNLQNLPRKGGVRACIKPREGYIFAICDYSNAEMRTLAQQLLTEGIQSELAREYIKDPMFDPHLYAAHKMWNIQEAESITFDQAKEMLAEGNKKLKNLRTLAKILNFGLAGGLSYTTFVNYARGFGVNLTLEESKKLCNQWVVVYPEMVDYFESRKRLYWTDDEMEKRVLTFPVSGRQRYLSRYTVACNTPFQGIAADGAKEALIQVWEECMSAEGPLSGCYPILFVHDEIVLEVPENIEKADAAAKRLGDLMVQGMEIHTPSIPAVAVPCLSKVWTKDAESEIGEDGLLSVYQG